MSLARRQRVVVVSRDAGKVESRRHGRVVVGVVVVVVVVVRIVVATGQFVHPSGWGGAEDEGLGSDEGAAAFLVITTIIKTTIRAAHWRRGEEQLAHLLVRRPRAVGAAAAAPVHLRPLALLGVKLAARQVDDGQLLLRAVALELRGAVRLIVQAAALEVGAALGAAAGAETEVSAQGRRLLLLLLLLLGDGGEGHHVGPGRAQLVVHLLQGPLGQRH